MAGALLRVAGLAAIYLLVLTSFAPGDILVGVLLAAGLVLGAGSARASRHPREWTRWLAAVTRMIATTAF
jgi:multisubunit Na+/H+ antiporter MnhE subunit